MVRKRPSGAVSIFLSCVLLVLIVFSCTIIDITRIQIAKTQADLALHLASQSILATYDSQLQSQYGLFARDFSSMGTICSELDSYINASLNPNTISTSNNVLFQKDYITENNFFLYHYNINDTNISKVNSLVNPNEVKNQILDYMQYRGPYVALEPFLDKMGAIEKASKTSEIIRQKNTIDSEIQDIEIGYFELEKLIDGININTFSGSLMTEIDGSPALNKNYVKKLYTSDTYLKPIYLSTEIPDDSLRNKLNNNVWFIDDLINGCKSEINGLYEKLSDLIDLDIRIKVTKEKIDSNEITRKNIIREISLLGTNSDNDYTLIIEHLSMTLQELDKCMQALKEKKAELTSDYKEGTKEFKKVYNELFDKRIPQFKALAGDYNELTFQYGYKGILEEALKQIQLIKDKTSIVAQDIKDYKQVLENEDDVYIDSACQSIAKEMENDERLLGISQDKSLSKLNNLADMESVIKNNLLVITNAEKDIKTITSCKNPLSNYYYKELSTAKDINSCEDVFKDLSLSSAKNNISEISSEDIINSFVSLENCLDEYRRDMVFDYGGMGDNKYCDFNYEELIKTVEEMFPGINLPRPDLEITSPDMPSELYESKDVKPAIINPEVDFDACSNYLNELSFFNQGLEGSLNALKDELYINEYIIGMFKAATDNIILENDNKDEAVTLSHYPKSEHYFNYEVEYIIFGDKKDVNNLIDSVAAIMAIRIGLNLIALISDSEKMELIQQISEAVAGWWSLGIGSIVLTALLTLAWACAESVSDVEKLLNGEQVPIIKNKMNWQTDIFNGIKSAAENKAEKQTEKEFIPSLRYQDYMRILLVTKFDDPSKYLRVLDLIQMNISKERNEDFILSQYITAYETEVNFDVNALFFKLPFMPKTNQSNYSFSKKAIAGY